MDGLLTAMGIAFTSTAVLVHILLEHHNIKKRLERLEERLIEAESEARAATSLARSLLKSAACPQRLEENEPQIHIDRRRS